jgi:hypothetical protein
MNLLNNNKGSILIISLVILYVLAAQSVSFSMFNASEANGSARYCRSVSAFWLAEAGVNMYMHDPTMLDNISFKTVDFGGGSIYLTRDDSQPLVRLISALGTFQGVQKKVQISYSANIPEVYQNTISSKGDIKVSGKRAFVIINDKTRLTGDVVNKSKNKLFIEDLQTKVDPSLTSLTDPQVQLSDNINAFQQFVQSNENLISHYPPDQVLFLKGQSTYTIDSSTSLAGKKIIFIEGDENSGSVVIQSNGILAQNQNLTIISTGTVTFNQSGYQAPNSQLNIIAWSGYNETVSAPSINRGIIYTHGIASFDQIMDSSTTNGSVIADGGFDFGEIWSMKVFNNADMVKGGNYPPGFEKLTGTSLNYKADSKPYLWQEIPI